MREARKSYRDFDMGDSRLGNDSAEKGKDDGDCRMMMWLRKKMMRLGLGWG